MTALMLYPLLRRNNIQNVDRLRDVVGRVSERVSFVVHDGCDFGCIELRAERLHRRARDTTENPMDMRRAIAGRDLAARQRGEYRGQALAVRLMARNAILR